MNGARHTIGDFEIQLWHNVIFRAESEGDPQYRSWMHTSVYAGLADITDGSALYHVPHGESLDGLIFRYTTRTVRAANWVDMAAPILVATIVSSFFRLWNRVLVTVKSSSSSIHNRCIHRQTHPHSNTTMQNLQQDDSTDELRR